MSALLTQARVPKDLGSVTSIRHESETDPKDVGADADAAERIWSAVERLYRGGLHPAIQLCVRRRGRVLVDRAIGYAHGGGPHDSPDAERIPATPETPFNVFSASKAITAMVIHLLDDRGLIHLDDRVCEYIPEFAAHGKQWVTIRHVLTHRAGIANIPPEAMDLDLLHRPDEIIRLLCETKPASRAGRRLAYHAITGGFVLGEVVRRVTGSDIRTVLDREIRRPLGFRWMNYGVEAADVEKVATNYFTGPPVLPPLSWMFRRLLGVDFEDVAEIGNDPRYLTSIIPSGNVVSTADEFSRFYQLLLNLGEIDGVRIFDRRTIHRAVSEQSYLEFDLSLGMPVQYGMGFMLGGSWFSFYGPDAEHAFGHIGFINVTTWADPERQVTAALMTSGKPLLYPGLYHYVDITRQIGLVCPKEPDFDWWEVPSQEQRRGRAPTGMAGA